MMSSGASLFASGERESGNFRHQALALIDFPQAPFLHQTGFRPVRRLMRDPEYEESDSCENPPLSPAWCEVYEPGWRASAEIFTA